MGTFKKREAWFIVGIVAAIALCVLSFSLFRLVQQTSGFKFLEKNEAIADRLKAAPRRLRAPTEEHRPSEKPQPALAALPSPTPSATPTPYSGDFKRLAATKKLETLGLKANEEGFVQAARGGMVAVIPAFLDLGLSPDTQDADGEPLLLAAAGLDNFTLVQQLLEAGADANTANAKRGDLRSPLMVAANKGNVAILDALVTYGGAINATNAKGQSALNFAIQGASLPAVQWLLEHGALPTDPSILNQALETNDMEMISTIIQRAQPENWTHTTREALYSALRVRNKPLAEVLIKNHRQQPTLEGYKQPLLGYLIAWGNTAAARMLVECGADANVPIGSPVEPAFAKLIPDTITRHYLQTEAGMTPLMVAAGLGQQETVTALLRQGAKRGALTSKSKFAALSFAARTGRPEIMQILLGKSPRPEDQHTRIVISLGTQRAILWKGNQIAVVAPVSTGREGYPTPSGRYVITDKEVVRHSNIYKVDMPYFMRLNCTEFGIHAGDVPNYPASHGCVRLPREAAIRFFKEADIGTLVNVEY